VSGQLSYPDLDASRNLLDRAGNGSALVVGDAMLDRYVSGLVDRISPEAPVPVVRVTEERLAIGGAANVAAGIRALGIGCRLVATVGDDAAGGALTEALATVGIPVDDLVVTPGRPTTEKTRVLARHQQMLRVDRESGSSLEENAVAALVGRAEAALDTAGVLVLQDYDKGVLGEQLVRRLLDGAARRGIPAIVDPKLRHFFEFRGAHVFKPNLRELAAAMGVEPSAIETADLSPIMARLGVANLLLTLGEEGMLLLGDDVDGVVRVPAQAREVYDVTGAGDTVLAVMATALLGSATLVEGALLATIAAGIEVSRLGAVPVTRDELLAEIEQHD